jgi:hypothetical protein
LSLGGCATAPPGRGWGHGATCVPGRQGLGRAAREAALAPSVWLPAACALALQIDGADARLASWAQRRAPVFGSSSQANTAGDVLMDAASAACLASIVAAPEEGSLPHRLADKARGGLVDLAAVSLTGTLTAELKSATRRERPDGTDQRSFPSGHASGSAALATLAARNAQALQIRDHPRSALEGVALSLAALCAWSRVEAGKHYPSDVLAGWVLGRFVARVADGAFLRSAGNRGWALSIQPQGGTTAIFIQRRF